MLWSFEPAVVRSATQVAAEVLGRFAPEVAERIPPVLAPPGPALGPELRFASSLTHRMVGYLGALLDPPRAWCERHSAAAAVDSVAHSPRVSAADSGRDRPGRKSRRRSEQGQQGERQQHPARGELTGQPPPEGGHSGHIERHAATQRQPARRRHRRPGGVVHEQLDPAREGDDPGDDHQMQVAIAVGGGEHRIGVIAEASGGLVGEAVEVGPPHPDRDQQGEAGCEDQLGAQLTPAGSDPDAERDHRFAKADEHEQAVPLREVLDGNLLEAPQPLARQPRRAGIVDQRRHHPQRGAMPAVQGDSTDQQQGHAGDHGRREPGDRRCRGVAALGRVDVDRQGAAAARARRRRRTGGPRRRTHEAARARR